MSTPAPYTTNPTLGQQLNVANPSQLADELRLVQLGYTLQKIKATVTGMTATAAPNITALTGTIVVNSGPADIVNSGVLPPIALAKTLRVTASGTAGSLGVYALGDAGATPAIPAGGAGVTTGVATISDDDKTLTFPNTITAFVIEYYTVPGLAFTNGVWTVANPLSGGFDTSA